MEWPTVEVVFNDCCNSLIIMLSQSRTMALLIRCPNSLSFQYPLEP